MISPQILIVDDEIPFVDTMTKRLTKRGFKVLKAFSGEEAIRILDENRNTDVVILDVKMPGMNGIETLKEIKSRNPLVEVIMLTGHATIDDAIEGMRQGAYDYLRKPCEIDELTTKLRKAVGKKREHEERIKEAKVREALARHGLE